MYQSYYPSYQMTYQQPNYNQYSNQQQNYQMQVPQGINGRIVNSIEEISANDVPMNTPFSIFPKNDMSEVYIKSWNNNGTISTRKYICEADETNTQKTSFDDVKNYIDERFDKLEKMLKPTSAKTKKESEEA